MRNFRDVGGLPTTDGRTVRTGRLYRSGHLARATDEDLDVLAGLGISTVIDFRGPHEVEADGADRLPAGVELVSIPMFDLESSTDIRTLLFSTAPERIAEVFGEGRAEQAMVRAATSFVTDEARGEQFALMVRTIIGAGAPTVIHCAAGKDRTGWAASLVLLVLGVSEDDVVEHYLASNLRRPEQHQKMVELEQAGVDITILEPLGEVREIYKRAALDALAERWGGIDGYCRDGLHLGDDEVALLRRELLAPVTA